MASDRNNRISVQALVTTYIEDQTSLINLCQQYNEAPVLAIDTEFVRTRTLYPRLGLLQVNDGKTLALIDPIKVDDLSPFWALLANANIRKVLHACSEDLEVFLTAGNCRPVNMIDSQVVMAFLGHGLSLGYAAMVNHYCGVELDKSESRTDWTKRPLSEKQLTYAQADVSYLFDIYPKIIDEITQAGWLKAAEQETELMITRKFTPINEDTLYQNIKMSWKLNAAQLNRLKHLASWRFQQAKKKDLPIGFVAKDDTLFGIAHINPETVGAMSSIEGVDRLDVKHKGRALHQVLSQANEVDASLHPKRVARLDEYPGYKQIFKNVKTFIKSEAEVVGLMPENFASKRQINQFLSWYFNVNGAANAPETVDILQGWRLTLFGEKLKGFANNKFKS